MTIAPGTTAFYDAWAADGVEAERSAVSRHFEAAFVCAPRAGSMAHPQWRVLLSGR